MANRNILAYSYFPVRRNHWAGGAQTFFETLLPGLVDVGLKFRILCPKVAYSEQLIEMPGTELFPVLEEPTRDGLKLDMRSKNLSSFREHLRWADAIWTLDEPFPLRVAQPIVSTLQTADGVEENQSILAFNWDSLVAASGFLLDCVKHIAGKEMWSDSESAPHAEVVFNGVDLQRFRATDSSDLSNRLGLRDDRRYIVFPHRPEAAKGIETALNLMRILKRRRTDYVLLVPANPLSTAAVREKQGGFVSSIRNRIREEGLTDVVIVHDWVAPEDMPQYLSLAEWCLVTTRLPEGFCYVPIQSIACGTPVLSTRCGALRYLLPEDGHGIRYFNPDEPESMAGSLTNCITPEDLSRGRNAIAERYDLTHCVAGYARSLRNAVPRRGMARGMRPSRVRPSPWWYKVSDTGSGGMKVWHDLQMRYIELTPQEAQTLRETQCTPVKASSLPARSVEMLLAHTLITQCE